MELGFGRMTKRRHRLVKCNKAASLADGFEQLATCRRVDVIHENTVPLDGTGDMIRPVPKH
jgi:hypothetical protein